MDPGLEEGDDPNMTPETLLVELFPNGIARYLIGGVLIGVGVAAIYVGTGLIPGASTFLETTLSYVSRLPRFNRGDYLASRGWRLVFVAGIVIGAGVYALAFQDGIWVTEVRPWRLLLGGVLVGVGTRLGKGCTSGHGICGVGSVSSTSIVNVATFVGVAVLTALLVQTAGVSP